MKLRYIVFITLILLITGSVACKKNNLSNIPSILFTSMYPDSIKAGHGGDSLYIRFSLKDGDADLGRPTGDDIFVKDSRYDSVLSYPFPDISSGAQNPATGIEGTCVFKYPATFIVPRDSLHRITGDTLYYELYIKDKAGNTSNHIVTPVLHITP